MFRGRVQIRVMTRIGVRVTVRVKVRDYSSSSIELQL